MSKLYSIKVGKDFIIRCDKKYITGMEIFYRPQKFYQVSLVFPGLFTNTKINVEISEKQFDKIWEDLVSVNGVDK